MERVETAHSLPATPTRRPRAGSPSRNGREDSPADPAKQIVPNGPVAQDVAWLHGSASDRRFPVWLQIFPPRQVAWKRYELPIADLPASLHGLRILHLSDFHFRTAWRPVYDLIIDRVQSNPPDLLLLTGDFCDSKRNPYPALPTVRRLLAGLTARLGCFGIVGNHDGYAVGYELRDSGVTFLDGKRHVISQEGVEIELIGLPGADRCDLDAAFVNRMPAKTAGVPRIVLSHHPDNLLRTRRLDADLFLAGHTHGGQVCLPGTIPIIKHDSLPRKLVRGIHRVDGTWLVVSRGLGATGLPLRVFCPPEAIELVLKQ